MKKYYNNGNKHSFRCEVLNWHKPSSKISVDGASLCAYCCRCGRPIMQDSQGNWFSVGEAPVAAEHKFSPIFKEGKR